MSSYEIFIPISVVIHATIEASSDDQAIDIAYILDIENNIIENLDQLKTTEITNIQVSRMEIGDIF